MGGGFGYFCLKNTESPDKEELRLFLQFSGYNFLTHSKFGHSRM